MSSVIDSLGSLGDAPLSAKDRQIKDGSKYDYLFPLPEFKKKLQIQDGSVDDTIREMKKIVKENSYQVRKLAKKLKVTNSDGTTDVRKSVKNIFDFVFDYIKYNLEDGEQLQTPAHTWQQAQVQARVNPSEQNSADCDCMSIFCGSLCLEMGIPFSFRITAYKNVLGLTKGWQHVYCIAHDPKTGKQVICDPVTNKFNYEKPYAQEKTYPMSLNGTDIYVLSGIDEKTNIYVEKEDGSLGLLNGKKKKTKKASKKAENKKKKETRKAAKKEKKVAKKEIKQARKSGDKQALEKAKAKKKAAKETIAENRTGFAKAMVKVGKGITKFTTATSLFIPRKFFLLLLRLNFRGLARRLSNNQKAYSKFENVWKKLGGGTKQLKKSIEKGKGKKALFGKKKGVGSLESELYTLGVTLGEYGVMNGLNLGLGMEPVTTSVGAAMASAAPIIAKIMNVFKQIGEFIPESADDAIANGEEVEEVDEDQTVTYDNDEFNNESQVVEPPTYPVEYEEEWQDPDFSLDQSSVQENEDDDEEADEEMEGFPIKSYADGYYYIDDVVDGLGQLSGKGVFKNVFKKVGGGIKKIGSKIKAKKGKKDKSAKTTKTTKNKKANKQATKQASKQNKQAKQSEKANKKANKQASKQASKQNKQATKQANEQPKQLQKEEKALTRGANFENFKNKVQDFSQSEAGQMIVDYGKQAAQQVIENNLPQQTIYESATPAQMQNQNINQKSMEKESFFKKHKGLVIGAGIAVLATTALIVFRKQIFGTGNSDKKNDKGKSLSGLNPIKKISIK